MNMQAAGFEVEPLKMRAAGIGRMARTGLSGLEMSMTWMLPLSKLALMSNEDLATVIIDS
jgi:hypothetical protein